MTNSNSPVLTGIIGGSGLYGLDLDNVREVTLSTPFGDPSGPVTIGELLGVPVAFLARHGKGHHISPAEVPSKANIYAFKQLGVERIISVSAVGSLKQEIAPLDMVVPDQLIDRTRLRESTFFGNGLVAHIPMAEPFCPELSAILNTAGTDAGATVHRGGALVVIEGPSFSTRAESFLYRSWGASIIGMDGPCRRRNWPVKQRSATRCWPAPPDYDVWHDDYESVTVEVVIGNLLKNVETSRRTLERLAPLLAGPRQCGCGDALRNAIITDRASIPQKTIDRLGVIVSKYIS